MIERDNMTAEEIAIHDLRRRDDTLAIQHQMILDKLVAIEAHQKESLELLTLFKTTKGFITTLRSIGFIVMWVTGVGGAISGLVYAIRIWIRG